MSLLRLALCSQEEEEAQEITIPEELLDDTELTELAQASTGLQEQSDELSASLESLMNFSLILESLKEECPQGHKTAEALLRVYGAQLPTIKPALESYSENPSADATLALEGAVGDAIRNTISNIFQFYVMSFKHQIDITMDFLSTAEKRAKRYKDYLEKTEKELQEKKSEFKENKHHANLVELWYFFSTKAGRSHNVIADLKSDTEASRFMLKEFPQEVLSTLNKASASIGRGKLDTEKNVASLLSDIEKLPSIDNLFPAKYAGDGILFNVITVERKIAPARHAVEIDGKQFMTLAENSARATITEKRSALHTAKKATTINPLFKIGLDLGKGFELSTDDIGKLIDFGKTYLRNVEDYVSLKRNIETSLTGLNSSLEHLKQTTGKLDAPKIREALKQVLDYTNNLTKAISTPASDEVLRSIRGAKYCNYLALRVIWNAKK